MKTQDKFQGTSGEGANKKLLDMIQSDLAAIYKQLDALGLRERALLEAKKALNGSGRDAPPARKRGKHKMLVQRGGWEKLVKENPGTLTIDMLAKLAGAPRDSASQALRALWAANKIDRVSRGVYRTRS